MSNSDKDEKIKELEEQLDDLQKEYLEFISIVSHDIAAPVRGMTGYASLLAKKYSEELDEKGQMYLDNIDISGKKFYELMAVLNELSRLSASKDPHIEVSTKELCEKIAEYYKDTPDCSFQFDYAALPTLIASEKQIHMIFDNLIANAIKFRKDNGKCEIGISCEDKDNEFIFCVYDNGIGIKEDYQEKIFRIFRKLHTDAEYDGLGAGLAMAKKAAALHKGSLWVESEPDIGSKFYFSIAKNQ